MFGIGLSGCGRSRRDLPFRWVLILLAGFVAQCDGCFSFDMGNNDGSSSSGCTMGRGGAALNQSCGPETRCANPLFGRE